MVEPVIKAVDVRIDRVIGAFDRSLGGWEMLAGESPAGDVAQALRARLFPDGIGFINIAPREEWTEIESRLTIIKNENLDPQLNSLGLDPIRLLPNDRPGSRRPHLPRRRWCLVPAR